MKNIREFEKDMFKMFVGLGIFATVLFALMLCYVCFTQPDHPNLETLIQAASTIVCSMWVGIFGGNIAMEVYNAKHNLNDEDEA